LSHNCYQDNFQHLPLHNVNSLLRIESVSGDSLPYFGYCELKIDLPVNENECVSEVIPVLVVPDTTYNRRVPLLVGTNLLHKLVNVQNCQNTALITAIRAIKLNNSHLEKSHGVVGEICAASNVKLKPFSSKVVKGNSTIAIPICQQIAVIESTEIPIVPGVVNVKQGRNEVYFEIFNQTNTEISISEGEKIAKLYQANIEEGQYEEQKEFIESFDLSHLTKNDQGELKSFLLKNRDVFALSFKEMGCSNVTEVKIDMNNSTPFRQKMRPVPPGAYSELKAHLLELVTSGVVKESKSPFSSNIVLARKKNGELRLCVDFRQLNDRCTRDSYAIPRVDMLMDSLKDARYFVSLDLFSGYHQLKICDEHTERTAFITPCGLYEYCKLPFGLKNAPSVFQRCMDKVLDGLIMKTCVVYLDDVVVHGKTKIELYQNLQEVFNRLRQANLKLKPQKCCFLKESVEFLGFEISQTGVKISDKHIEDVQKWAIPTNIKELQQYLGFMNFFRKHILNYAKIAEPLTRLLRGHSNKKSKKTRPRTNAISVVGEAEWIWGVEQQTAFDELKTILLSPPVLVYPDFTKPFVLHCDASVQGLGGALYQEDSSGKLHPVAFGSRTLSAAEKNYSTHKLEFLALKWSVTSKFKYYLYGSRFHVFTDHNPLLYLTTTAKLDALGHRWLAELSIYDFEISYKPGLTNVVADSLSRQVPEQKQRECTRHVSQDVFQELCRLLDSGEFSGVAENLVTPGNVVSQAVMMDNHPRVDWKEEQGKDVTVDRVRHLVKIEAKMTKCQREKESVAVRKLWTCRDHLVVKDDVLFKSQEIADGQKRLRIVVPEHLRTIVLSMSHDDLGHLGRDKTISIAQERFYWTGLTKSVEDHIRNCKVCICAKTPYVPSYAPLVNIVTTRPFELVCMDFLSLEECKGRFKNVLVITDHFTRYSWAYATRDQEAKTVANILYREIILKFGICERFHSDMGGSFEAKVIYQLCKLLGISKSKTTCYHPMGNGATERFNRTLLSMLRTLTDDQKLNWRDHLASLVFSYNCCRHESTGYSPFYLMFGRTPRLPIDVYLGTSESETANQTIEAVKQNLDVAFQIAREAVKKAQAKQTKTYNRKVRGSTIEVGDFVLVQNVGLKGKHKLANKWSPHLHIVVSQPNPDIPVFRVRPENGSRDRVLHRNMLLPLSLPWMVEQNQPRDMDGVDGVDEQTDDEEEVKVQITRRLPQLDAESVQDDGETNSNYADDDPGLDMDDHDESNGELEYDAVDTENDGVAGEVLGEPSAKPLRSSQRNRRPPVRLQDYICSQTNVSLLDWQLKVASLMQLLPIFPLNHSDICATILYVIRDA
jgi:transposase InsO family protein/dUTPase